MTKQALAKRQLGTSGWGLAHIKVQIHDSPDCRWLWCTKSSLGSGLSLRQLAGHPVV